MRLILAFLLSICVVSHAQERNHLQHRIKKSPFSEPGLDETMGVWTKFGTVIEPTTSDLNGGVFFSGTSNSSVLYDINPQLISPNFDSKVFKMWFMGGNDLFYAESNDGKNFTRRGTAIKTNFGVAKVIKDGSTYYLYGASSPTTPPAALDAYTSSDGITFTLAKSGALVIGGVGKWDHSNVYYLTPFYKDGGNVWHATYSSGNFGSNAQVGIATSPDLLNWTNAPNFSVDNMGGNEGHVVNGSFYIYGGTVPAGHTGFPADLCRAMSTDLSTWGSVLVIIPRTQTNEGVGNNSSEGIGVVNLVEANNKSYLYYSATNTANGTGYTIMGAVADMPLATLVLGNEGIADNVAFTFTQLATDNFTRANETPLSNGGKWSIAASPNVQANLVSNNAVGTNINNASRMIWTAISWPADQYSQATIGTGFASTSFFGANVRAATAAATQYEFLVAPTSYILRKIIAGSATNLKTGSGTFAVGDVIKIAISGTTVTGYKNGTQVDTASDGAIATGSAEFTLADTSTADNAKASNWIGGAVNATSTASSGTTQSAIINNAFAQQLVVNVKDSLGNNLQGVTVTFAAPGAGASCTFAGGVLTATTDASGNATSAVITANATAGAYIVTGTADGLPAVNFNLTNTASGNGSIGWTNRQHRFANKRG